MFPRLRFKQIFRMRINFSRDGVSTNTYGGRDWNSDEIWLHYWQVQCFPETLVRTSQLPCRTNLRNYRYQLEKVKGLEYIHQHINIKVLPSPYRRISFFHHNSFNLFLFLKWHHKSFNLLSSCRTKKGYYFSRSKKNNWTHDIKLMLLIVICVLVNILRPWRIKR